MGLVESPKFLHEFSEAMTYMSKDIVNMLLPVPMYSEIPMIPKIGPSPLHTLESLNPIYCYMDDIITEVQSRLE